MAEKEKGKKRGLIKVCVVDIIGAWRFLASSIKGSILTDDEVAVEMVKVRNRIHVKLNCEIIRIMEFIYKEPEAYISQYVKHDGEIIFLKDKIVVNVSLGSMPAFCAMHLFFEALKFLKNGRVEKIKAKAEKTVKKIMQAANTQLPGNIEEYLDIMCYYGKGIFTVVIKNKRIRKKKMEISGKNVEEISAALKEKLLKKPQIISNALPR